MKRVLLIVSLLFLAACSINEIQDGGASLKVAVVGDIPKLNNGEIHFEPISLEELSEDTLHISAIFDAVMITPVMFEEASDDRFVEVYNNAKMPIIFWNSPKSHYPFYKWRDYI